MLSWRSLLAVNYTGTKCFKWFRNHPIPAPGFEFSKTEQRIRMLDRLWDEPRDHKNVRKFKHFHFIIEANTSLIIKYLLDDI